MHPDSLHEHYHQPDLLRMILTAFRAAGIDPDQLADDDLVNLDEFHIGGRPATAELARLAGLTPQHRVLDLGAGIGGPARYLAATYGCRVTGLELIPAYCEAAAGLTRRVGLADRVDFVQGTMCAMPFQASSFDRVWLQHVTMNVPDKRRLAGEIRDVLRPGGRVVMHEICERSGEPLALPVPWASRPEQSHVASSGWLRGCLAGAGLVEEHWADVSEQALVWFAESARKPREKGRPGLGMLMGRTAAQKSRNLVQNLREGRIKVVQGSWRG